MPEGKDGLVYRAQLDNNGMRYVVRLRAVAKGGTVSNTDGRFTVKGADEVTFLLTADTDYRLNLDPKFDDPKAYVGVDPERTTAKWMKAAARQSYSSLFARHYKDYAALFDRVQLQLDSTPDSLRNLPTDRRLAAYRNAHRIMISRRSTSSLAAICSSLLRDRAISRRTCKGCGTTTSMARGAWTTTTTSTCK